MGEQFGASSGTIRLTFIAPGTSAVPEGGVSRSYHDSDDMPEQSEPDDLSSEVIRVIAQTQRIPAEDISLDSTFEELKIDSLDGINIVFALEDKFGINIPDEGVQNLHSVRETVAGVQQLLMQKEAAAPPGAA